MTKKQATPVAVIEIPLESLADGDNPRETMDKAELKELERSIRSCGVLTPIRVRPSDKGGKGFQIVFGHRRAEAARRAGLEKIPAQVVDVSDAQALEDALTENRVRVDVDPLEEASAVARLVELGKPIREVAASLGITAARVRRLANLSTLLPSVRDEIASSEYRLTWTEDLLELIALVAPSVQTDLIADLDFTWTAPDIETLRTTIRDLCRRLDLAPWKLTDDALAPARPTCEKCEERSDVVGGLFEGITEKAPDGAAVCRNSACWAEKAGAWLSDAYAAAREEHGDKLTLVHDSKRDGELLRNWSVKGKHPLGDWDYKVSRSKKSTSGTPAFVVSGRRQGSIIRIKVNSPTTFGAEPQVQGLPKPEKGSADDLAAKQAHLAKRRRAWIVDFVRERLDALVDQVETGKGKGASMRIPSHVAMRLAATYGSDTIWEELGPIEIKSLARRVTILGVVRPQISNLMRSGFAGLDRLEEIAVDFSASLLGLGTEHLAGLAAEAIPTPRALAVLHEKLEQTPEP